MAPFSVWKTKKPVNEGGEATFNVSLSYEIEATTALHGTEDAKEGFKALVDHRKPEFQWE
ncbi:MAG: hypothetical protein QW292_05890 [Candidatus Parvarchaeota archaeon]